MARYPKEAVCKTCATPFIHNGERLRKYCSRKCFLASVSIQRQVTKICPTCSKPFLVVVSNKSRNFTCCSSACSGAYRRRDSYDISFLDTDNAFRSWFLGWIMSDGHVSKHGSVVLAITDKQIIDIMAEQTKYKNKIGLETKDRLSPRYSIRFSACTGSKLNSFGFFYGSKTGKEFIPNCVSDSTFSHFFRGFVEGDGTLWLDKNNHLTLGICSASKEILLSLLQRLKNFNLVYGRIHPSKEANLYSITFKHADSQRICQFMYTDSESMRLDRKYERYVVSKSVKLINNLQPEFCTVPGCTRPCAQKNMCSYHYSKKYKSENKDKIKEHNKLYRIRHKEAIQERNKRYDNKNKEKRGNNQRRYYLANKERLQKRDHDYYLKNRERMLSNHQKYREANKEKAHKYYQDNKTRWHLYYLKRKEQINNQELAA